MSRKSTPVMRQVQRQPTIDGLYTLDPQDYLAQYPDNGLHPIDSHDERAGLQHISADPYIHKHARPRTFEGLQAGIPTKHLAGLQRSVEDAPQVIEDNSHLQPRYFERDFKKWESPAPIRVLGLRRRIFYGGLVIIIIILAAITAGIAVGVSSVQRKSEDDRQQAGSATQTHSTSMPSQTPSPANTSMTSLKSTTARMLTTYPVESTATWSHTLQTVPIFSGSIEPNAKPAYFTTATFSAERQFSTNDVGQIALIDCPTKNGTIFNASNGVKYTKLCYQAMDGLAIRHRTSTATFDDCLESCALAYAGGEKIDNTYRCMAASWQANLTMISMEPSGFKAPNCFFYSTVGNGSPGNFMTISAIIYADGSQDTGQSG